MLPALLANLSEKRISDRTEEHVCSGVINRTPLFQGSCTDTGIILAAVSVRVLILNDPPDSWMGDVV